jgi:hypothetical protein
MYLQGEGKIVEHKLNGKKSEVNLCQTIIKYTFANDSDSLPVILSSMKLID